MKETSIYLKYDGEQDSYKKHQIDAKELAFALENLADLIYDANTLLNGPDAFVQVNAQAGFIKGSFGLELIVGQDPAAAKEVLEYLGLAGSAIAGGLIPILLRLRNRKPKPADIEINEETSTASVAVGTGEEREELEFSKDVYDLMNTPVIRKRLNKIIQEPLNKKGTSSFQILASPEKDDKPLVVVPKEAGEFFKAIRPPRPDEELESDTVATIEFLTSNKESGTTGWKIRHLGQEVPVKVKDEAFLISIQRPDAPSIYGLKYSVDLHVKVNKRKGQPDKKSYRIDKVRSVVKGS